MLKLKVVVNCMSNRLQELVENGQYEDGCKLIDGDPSLSGLNEISCLYSIVSYYQCERLDDVKRLCDAYFYLVPRIRVTTVSMGQH